MTVLPVNPAATAKIGDIAYLSGDYTFLNNVRSSLNGTKKRVNKYGGPFLEKVKVFNFKGKFLPEVVNLAKGSESHNTSDDDLASAVGENQNIRAFVLNSPDDLKWVGEHKEYAFSVSLLKDADINSKVAALSPTVSGGSGINPSANKATFLNLVVPSTSSPDVLRFMGTVVIDKGTANTRESNGELQAHRFKKGGIAAKVAENLCIETARERAFRKDFLEKVEAERFSDSDLPYLVQSAQCSKRNPNNDVLLFSLGKNPSVRKEVLSSPLSNKYIEWIIQNRNHPFAKALIECKPIVAKLAPALITKQLINYLRDPSTEVQFTQDEIERTNFRNKDAAQIFSLISGNRGLSTNLVVFYLGYNHSIRDYIASSPSAISWLQMNRQHTIFSPLLNDRRIATQVGSAQEDIWTRSGRRP